MQIPAAFFFDSEEFHGFYGPPINSAFFRSLADTGNADACEFHVFMGDLLMHTLTRRIAEVKFGGPPSH